MGSFKVGSFTIAQGGTAKVNDVPLLTELWRDGEFLTYLNGAVVTSMPQAMQAAPERPFVIENGNVTTYDSIQDAVDHAQPNAIIYVPEWYANGKNEHVDITKAVVLAGVPFGRAQIGSVDIAAFCMLSGIVVRGSVTDTGGGVIFGCELPGPIYVGAGVTTQILYSRLGSLTLASGSSVQLTNSMVDVASGPSSATLSAHASVVGSVNGELVVRCGLLGDISGSPNAKLVLPFGDVAPGSVLSWDGTGWIPVELHGLAGGIPAVPFIIRNGAPVTFGSLSEALQSALQNETVYVPPGQWDVTGCIVRDNVRVIGIGHPRLVVRPGLTGQSLTLRTCSLYGVAIARDSDDDYGGDAPPVVTVADNSRATMTLCSIAQQTPFGGTKVPNVRVGFDAVLTLDYTAMTHYGGDFSLPAIECREYAQLRLRYCDINCHMTAASLELGAKVVAYHSNVYGIVDGVGTVEATLSNLLAVFCKLYSFASHVSFSTLPLYEYFGMLPLHPGNIRDLPAVPVVTGDSFPFSVWAKFALSGLPDVNTAGANIGDVLSWDGAVWRPVPAGTPGTHASTHQAGGTDEISVAGLHGRLADFQAADQIGPWSIDVGKEPSVGDVLTWDGQRITWSRPPSGTGLAQLGTPDSPLAMPNAAIASAPSGNSPGSLQVQISTSSVPR